MKRFNRIYILLGVLALSCIATFSVKRFEEHKEQIKNSDEIIMEVSSDSVQSLSWEYESETLSFHKDEKWLYDEDEAFPVDEEKINKLLKQFEAFGVSFIIEDVEDYSQYGLNEPTCTINLTTEEQSYEIVLGNYSSMDSERYVSMGDGNVYLVKEDPMDHFNITLRDMIKHDEAPVFDKSEAIQFAGAEDYKIVYEEESSNTYCADDVYFTEQDGESLPLDTSRVESYLNSITYLDLSNYVTYNVTEDELKSYGLDQPELTVTVDYVSEGEEGEEIPNTFVLNISRDPEEKESVQESIEDDGDSEEEEIAAYARVGESPIVYQIFSDDYKELMEASYDSLRHQEVFSGDFTEVTQIDISLEGSVYTITSEQEEDSRTYYYKGEELEIADFRSALKNLKADSFTQEQPTQKEEIGITVYLDNENYQEVQINLYRYDGSVCLAAVDGKPVSLIKRSQAVDLIEAVNAIVLN